MPQPIKMLWVIAHKSWFFFRAPADDIKLNSRIRAWFANKSPTDKSTPKPPKPYKTSKVKAIRIVDGEVIELDGKKGLRKLLCWK